MNEHLTINRVNKLVCMFENLAFTLRSKITLDDYFVMKNDHTADTSARYLMTELILFLNRKYLVI